LSPILSYWGAGGAGVGLITNGAALGAQVKMRRRVYIATLLKAKI